MNAERLVRGPLPTVAAMSGRERGKVRFSLADGGGGQTPSALGVLGVCP